MLACLSIHSRINCDFVDIALARYQHCLRIVFASKLIWEWNLFAPATEAGNRQPASLARHATLCRVGEPSVTLITKRLKLARMGP